jgi:DNA replication protein DnaC
MTTIQNQQLVDEGPVHVRKALESVTIPSGPAKRSLPEPIRFVETERSIARIGRRYRECRLSNFSTHGTAEEVASQKAAVASVWEFCETLNTQVEAGRNVVLFGPPGTGKDHILAAMLRVAAIAEIDFCWTNGIDLFSQVRDAIDTETKERVLIRQWCDPAILAISDPVPPWGPLTQWQASILFQIVDRRYRDCKPVWITGNFADDASDRLGAQVVDRLKHDALVISCQWSSWRQV